MGALDTAIDGALDPLDGAIDGVVGDKRKANVYNAVQQNPDEFAQAAQLSRSTGLPAPVVARNLPQVKQRADLDALDGVIEQSPAVRKAMDDPTFAILARDDAETLAEIERTAGRRAGGRIGGPAFKREKWTEPTPTVFDEISRQVSGATRSLAAGMLTDFNAAAWGWAEGGAKLVGADTLGGFFGGQRRGQEALGKSIQGDYGQGIVEGGVASGFRSFGNMLPATVASVLTGNPAFMLGVGSATAGGQAVGKGVDKGLEPWRALAYGAEDAVAEYATEKLPVGRLFKDLKAGTPFFKLLGMQMATEIPTELAATTWQNFNEWANLNPEKSFEDYANELGPDLAQTVIATVTQTILSAGMAKGVSRATQGIYDAQQKAATAGQEAEALAQLSQLAAASKLRERDPQTFEQYVEAAAPGQEVYLDARTLQQSGVDLAALAQASPAVAAQITEALATGGDITIPVSEYAARLAGTDLDTALLPHLRASEDALSQDEAQRFYQGQAEEFKNAAAKVMEDKATDDAWQASAKAVETQLLDQLQQTGRFTPDVNNAYATLMRDFYVATAARLGVTPEEMAARYPIRIAAQSADGGQVLSQEDISAAEKAGFDSSQVWLHGTTKDFTSFKAGKKGVNELGEGIYFTKSPLYANAWARGEGAHIMPVLLKRGDFINLDEFHMRASYGDLGPYQALAERIRQRPENMPETARDWVEQPVDDFARFIKDSVKRGGLNTWLDRAGYVGAYDPYSQIPDQVVVFRPENIRSVNAKFNPKKASSKNILAQAANKVIDLLKGGDPSGKEGQGRRQEVLTDEGTASLDMGQFFQGQAGNRAEIRFGEDITQQPSVIALFNNADLSSFLHEMGHFQLEVLAHIASQPNAPAEIVQDMERVLKWFGITGTEEVAGGDQAGSLGQGVIPPNVEAAALAAAREVQDEMDAFDLAEEIKSIQQGGNIDLSSLASDPRYYDAENEEFTPEGFAEVDRLTEARARDNLRLGTLDDISDLNNAHHWAQYAAMLKILDGLGIEYQDTSSSQSKYIEVNGYKLRFADHANQVRDSAVRGVLPVVNVAPGEAKFLDALRVALSKVGGGETAGSLGQGAVQDLTAEDAAKLIAEDDELFNALDAYVAEGEAFDDNPELAKRFLGILNRIKPYQSYLEALYRGEPNQKPVTRKAGRGFTSFSSSYKTAEEFAKDAAYPGNRQIVKTTGKIQALSLEDIYTARMRTHPGESYYSMQSEYFVPDTQARVQDRLFQGGDEGTKGELPKRRTALEVWQTMSLEEKRPYHEQFARGFEAYLFEGKAPSPELTSVFQRFRAWLISVYKSIKALNVEISDDIRGVFDRLVATDEAIKAAEAARAYTPLFPDDPEAQALAAKATQDATDELQRRSLRDMRWLDNARGRILKQMQADAKAKRQSVEAEVRAEVAAMPVWQAKDLIKSNPDTDRDTVAEMFGFTSGDHLGKEIKAAGNRAVLVEGMTDQRVLERYGDLTSPDVMARAVDEAIHNEARARFVATELKALNKAAGPVRAISKAAKDFAETTVARKQVKAIKPARHAAAETRAAKAAEKALAAGDTALAADEKRNQLIQNYATRASYDALTEVDKALRYFAKLDGEGTRKNLDAEYLDQIDALLERFDFRKSVSNKDAKKRATLVEWVQGQRDEGFEPDIPPDLLAEAMRKPYKEMTLEELRGLVDTVKQIEHLGRLKRKLLTAKDEREFKAIRDEIAASIAEHAKGVRDLRTRNLTSDALKDAGARFLAMHRKMASVSREMDGFKDGGPMWEYLIRSMNSAGDRESGMRADATARLHALVKPLLASGKMGGKGIYFESLGGSFNREERIAIALNLGNAGNMQRLLDGEGWTMTRLRPLLDTITAEEAEFVQSVWDFFESYRPEIAAKERRIYGKEPVWVEPVPITLGGKELKGGYYPVKYDRARSERAAAHEDAESAKAQMKGAYTSATTRRSFTKTRAEEVTGRPLLYSFAGIYQGTNEVIHDLAWHEWLIDANRLVRSLSGTISTYYGDETRDLFKKAIEDIAAGDVPAQNVFERGINHLRMGATVAGLGWNFSTALLQPFGLTQSMVRIGPAWVVKGLSQWIKSPIATGNDVAERSAFMRDRARTMQREINEIQNQVRGSKLDPVRATFFLMIQKMQMVADMPTWLGAYEKAIAEGNAEDRAVSLADQAVMDAQGSGQVKDLAQIQRGGPLLKLWTNFYSFFNTTYNLAVEKTKEKGSDPKLYPSLAIDYLLLFVIPCAMVTLVKAALQGEDDEDELVKKLAADQISYLLGTMVGLRELTAAMQKLAGVEQFKSSYGGPAGLRMFQEVDKLSTQMAQGEIDAALLKAVNNTAGNLLHYPSGQINRTAGGVAAIVEGKTDNPMAVLLGPPPKK